MSKYTTDQQLDSWFAYHAPTSPTIARGHERVREECRRLAGVLSELLPEGPDKTVALRAVRTVMYEANACIAVAQRLHGPEFQTGQAVVPTHRGSDLDPQEGSP